VTMEDYVADVASVTQQIAAAGGSHPIMAGWSMGGLIAMMYAAAHEDTPGLLLFSPSPPLEVAGRAPPEEVRQTPSAPFGPELYGVFPDDPNASREALYDLSEEEARRVLVNSAGAQESGLARRQRKRGISVPAGSIRAPSLVVYGEEDRHFPPDLNRRLAIYLAGESLSVPRSGHWGIVCSERAVAATAPGVDAWLRANIQED
jgi:pimeloyl-ACP methyl ester carboxylesterase